MQEMTFPIKFITIAFSFFVQHPVLPDDPLLFSELTLKFPLNQKIHGAPLLYKILWGNLLEWVDGIEERPHSLFGE